jgi:hypothetical protein
MHERGAAQDGPSRYRSRYCVLQRNSPFNGLAAFSHSRRQRIKAEQSGLAKLKI